MDLYLYGIIGDAAARLDAATIVPMIQTAVGGINVHINSLGGLVFDGFAIFNALSQSSRHISVYIDGIAGSIASIIAMAGDEIVMADNAVMMIHKPSDSTYGVAPDLRAAADRLDLLQAQLVNIYAQRTGLSPADLSPMLDAETWMTAAEAQSMNFIDRIAGPSMAMNMLDATGFRFSSLPDHPLIAKSPTCAASPGATSPKETIMTGATAPTPTPAPGPTNTVDPVAAAVAAERERVNTIRNEVARAGIADAAFSDTLVNSGATIDRARTSIIDHIAENAPVITNFRPAGVQTFDNPAFTAQAIADTLYARMSGRRPDGAAASMMNMTMTDMARELLERRGVPGVRRMRPMEVFNIASQPRNDFGQMGGMMTTSDFPGLMQSAGRRFLLDIFQAAASAIKQLGTARPANDFRAITALKLSGAGLLDEVPEAGQIARGEFTEGSENYRVKTFSKIFALSRQALINDDLGAFANPLRIMGRSAAETEAQQLAGLLTANAGKGVTLADGKPLFDAAHGNLAAAASVPGVNAFSVGRRAMRAQKDTDGVTPLNGTARYVICGTAQETIVDQFTSTAYTPAVSADINPFTGLTPLVEPRISDIAWYLFADPGAMPVIEYAYLNGGDGPMMDTKDGWDVLGTEFRVVLDFGCGVVDHRGAYLNTGVDPNP